MDDLEMKELQEENMYLKKRNLELSQRVIDLKQQLTSLEETLKKLESNGLIKIHQVHLKNREKVAELSAAGISPKEGAERLGVGLATYYRYLKELKEKTTGSKEGS